MLEDTDFNVILQSDNRNSRRETHFGREWISERFPNAKSMVHTRRQRVKVPIFVRLLFILSILGFGGSRIKIPNL